MNTMETISKRRSIRKYQTKPVEAEKIEKLLRAAMQAPSSCNQQPWELLVIQERKVLDVLAQSSLYTHPLEEAPLAIVMLANEKRMFFPQNWEQDMGAAAQNILLAAVELGLGALWMGIAPEPKRMNEIRKMFDLPEHIRPYCLIGVGYPADDGGNHFIDRYDKSRIYFEKYE